MYMGRHVKYSLLLPDFKETRIFLACFLKVLNIKFHENSFIGCFMRADRQTNRHDEADSRFDSFANAPKNNTISAIIVTAASVSVNSECVCPVSIDCRCKYGWHSLRTPSSNNHTVYVLSHLLLVGMEALHDAGSQGTLVATVGVGFLNCRTEDILFNDTFSWYYVAGVAWPTMVHTLNYKS